MGHFVGGGFNPTGMLFAFLGDIYGLEPRIFTFTFDRWSLNRTLNVWGGSNLMHFGMVIFVRDFPEKLVHCLGWYHIMTHYFFPWKLPGHKKCWAKKNHCKEILSQCFLAATFANKWIGNHPNHRICPENLCLVSYFCSGTSLLMQQEMILPIGTSLDFMGTLGTLFRNRLYSWP